MPGFRLDGSRTAREYSKSLKLCECSLCVTLVLLILLSVASYASYWSFQHFHVVQEQCRVKETRDKREAEEMWANGPCKTKGAQYVTPRINCKQIDLDASVNVEDKCHNKAIDDLKMHVLLWPTLGLCDAHDHNYTCLNALLRMHEIMSEWRWLMGFGMLSGAAVFIIGVLFVVLPIIQCCSIRQMITARRLAEEQERQAMMSKPGYSLVQQARQLFDNGTGELDVNQLASLHEQAQQLHARQKSEEIALRATPATHYDIDASDWFTSSFASPLPPAPSSKRVE